MEPCEMNPDTFDFDYSALKNMLGSNEDHISREEKQKEILAILPTNFFGIPSDIQHIRKLISDPDITIIEDSAQSMGEKRAEGYQGTGGDVGFFSLGRGKAFSTIEGGIIITNRKDIADTISSQLEDVPSYTPSGIIKLFLQSIVLWLFMFPRLFWIPKSMPFLKLGETIYDPDFPIKQLNPFQVGLTRGWQKKLAHLRNTRKSNIKNWLSILPAQYYPFLKKYTNNPPACIRLPIRIRNKKLLDSLQQNSDNKGWGVMPTYPNTLDIFLRAETRQGNKNFAYPSAKILCDEIVTLPAHPYITGKDIRNISEMMRQTALLFPDTERQPNPLT